MFDIIVIGAMVLGALLGAGIGYNKFSRVFTKGFHGFIFLLPISYFVVALSAYYFDEIFVTILDLFNFLPILHKFYIPIILMGIVVAIILKIIFAILRWISGNGVFGRLIGFIIGAAWFGVLAIVALHFLGYIPSLTDWISSLSSKLFFGDWHLWLSIFDGALKALAESI